MDVSFIMIHTSALVLGTACTATQQYITLASGSIRTKTKTRTNAGITVTVVEIWTPVHATVALCPPASVQITTIPTLSLQQLVQSQTLTVCSITIHTSALVLSTACTATQKCMLSPCGYIRTKTNTSVWIITVTALVIKTPVHVLVALCPPVSVRLTTIT